MVIVGRQVDRAGAGPASHLTTFSSPPSFVCLELPVVLSNEPSPTYSQGSRLITPTAFFLAARLRDQQTTKKQKTSKGPKKKRNNFQSFPPQGTLDEKTRVDPPTHYLDRHCTIQPTTYRSRDPNANCRTRQPSLLLYAYLLQHYYCPLCATALAGRGANQSAYTHIP